MFSLKHPMMYIQRYLSYCKNLHEYACDLNIIFKKYFFSLIFLQQEINTLRHTTELYEAVKIDKKQLEIEIYQLKDQLHRVMEHNDKLIKLNADLDQRLTASQGHRERKQHVVPQLVAPAPRGQFPTAAASGPAVVQEVFKIPARPLKINFFFL